MKKIIFLFYLTLAGALNLHSQVYNIDSLKSATRSISESSMIDPAKYTPKIYAPSSNSFLFMKYGGLTAEGGNGTFYHSIPLFELKYKDITLPITLNYSSGGLRVDEREGISGVQWSLNYGGLVTRIMKGKPDDNSTKWYPINIDYHNLTTEERKDLYNIAMGRSSKDTEQDHFSFTINGQSGSFFIDENKNVFTSSPSFVKIEFFSIDLSINREYSSFIITDGNGYKYFFGGDIKYVDETFSTNESADLPQTINYISTWQLKEIKSPLSNSIYFDYINYSTTTYDASSSLFVVPYEQNLDNLSANESVNIQSTRTEGKLINRIYTTDNAIDLKFGYVKEKLVETIDLKNDNNSIRSVRMDYQTIKGQGDLPEELSKITKPEERNFLNQISFFDKSKNNSLKYIFDYYSLEQVMSPGAKAKDKYGFHGHGYDRPYTQSEWEWLSSRGLPDAYEYLFKANLEVYPIKSDVGMLKRITYPTGGYTEIKYEPNSILGLIQKKRKTSEGVSQSYSKDNSKGDGVDTKVFTASEDIYKLLITRTTALDTDRGHKGDGATGPAYFTLKVNGATIFEGNHNVGTYLNNGQGINESEEIFPIIKKGSTIELSITVPREGEYRHSSFGIQYDETYYENELVYFGGARAKNIVDFSTDGIESNQKTYYYNKLSAYPSLESSIQHESISNSDAINSYQYMVPEYRPGVTGATFVQRTAHVVTPFPYGYYYSIVGQSPTYSSITEFFETNGKSNGAIQRDFIVPDRKIGGVIGAGPIPIQIPPITNYNESLRGRLKEQSIFELKDNKYILQQKSINNYELLYDKAIQSYSISSLDQLNLSLDQDIKKISIIKYDNYIQLYKLSNTIDSVFINNFPSVSTSKFIYNKSPYYDIKKKLYLLSSIDKFETTFNYPYDQVTDIYYKELVDQNRISTPVEEIKLYNEKEVERNKITYFKDPIKTNNLVLPYQILTSKEGVNKLSTEVTYDQYDAKGNLLQYTGKDGISVSYLWSYKGQYPIAEIKNATYADVQAALGVDPSTISDLEKPDMSKIDALRSKLTNAMVTTYTYKPLVGMLTATDPTGVTTHYEYDDFGRLSHTYIDNEKAGKDLLQTIQYNY